MKSRVYIETSVVSYYTARPSRDIIAAARQELTRDSWKRINSDFDCYISVLVVQEAGSGDKIAASKRLEALSGIPVLDLDFEAESLANFLIADGVIPKKYPEDALHIALAAQNGMDYLVTWNFTHIHNAQMENSIRRTIEKYGYQCPVFCSPPELIGDR